MLQTTANNSSSTTANSENSGVRAGEGGLIPRTWRDNPQCVDKTVCKNYVTWAQITTNELQTQLECNTIALSDEARMSGQGTAAIREYRVAEGASCGPCTAYRPQLLQRK